MNITALDKKSTKDHVLKLKTNDGPQATQIRRLYVSDLWGDDELSYSKMIKAAVKFASAESDVVDWTTAKVTYMDGDGDRITISSDEELTDSFRQSLKSSSTFRLSVLFQMGDPDAKNIPAMVTGKNPQKLMRIERQIARKSGQLEALKVKAKLASSNGSNGGKKPMGWMNAQKFDSNFFIHARHTCDGCSKTPIIGTRYHAQKIPDFDLCATCFSKYEGEDLDFKPEALGKYFSQLDDHFYLNIRNLNLFSIQSLDRDRNMQQRWLRRQLSNSRMCEIHASSPCEGFRPNKKAKAEGQAKGNGANHVEAAIDFLKTLSPAVVQSLKDVEIHVSSPPCQGYSDGKPKSEDKASKDDVMSKSQDTPVAAASKPDSEEGSNETEPKSESSGSNDDSFLSDADGNSIAEVIGRTLDVCVQAMEDVMIDDAVSSNDVAAAASAVAADAFSVASSIADALKSSDNFKSANASSQTDAAVKEEKVEKSKNEEAEDDWSVVSDEKSKAKEVVTGEETDKSVTSVEPISAVVLAKWDAELKQLHELGFLDDRINTNALESLEASHIGCNSEEKVTVNSVVEYLLK